VRFTPTLTFARDTTSDSVQRMDELLARARAADADLAKVRSGAKPAGEPDPYRLPPAPSDDGVDAEDTGDGDQPEH
jgi:ribosome-binding factor A